MKRIELQTSQRTEMIPITDQVQRAVDDSGVSEGICHVYVPHTTAALAINENADPDVQVDMESLINAMVPEEFPYVHRMEGPDDMPAHMKASLMGASVTVPVQDGKLALGTWQGIYLCEHRNHGGRRRLILTLHGTEAS